MVSEMKAVMAAINENLSASDNVHDRQCNDMALNHLKIALEWQKRKFKKPPDLSHSIDVCAMTANSLSER